MGCILGIDVNGINCWATWRCKKRSDLQRQLAFAIKKCNNDAALQAALDILQSDDDAGEDKDMLVLRPRPSIMRELSRKNSIICVLETVKVMRGRIGLDIGGTLAKMAFMQPSRDSKGELPTPLQFGKSGHKHEELGFHVVFGQVGYNLHFVSGSTDALEIALKYAPTASGDAGFARQVVATGGGAHRFKQVMADTLNVQMLPFQEMLSLVNGLEFLTSSGPDDEVFTIDSAGAEVISDIPSQLYPCLLVNMGSGVSIIRIDAPDSASSSENGEEPNFVRVGGTACGGATFLGLGRLLTSARTFPELMELAQNGHPENVNKLVSDIYGSEGCASLGLPPTLTAAHFGKLVAAEGDARLATSEADIAAALLILVVQESAVLGRALSLLVQASIGRSPPVFFVGGFLAENKLGWKTIANSFRTLGLPSPLFLRHADFLGALGALRQCVHSHQGSV